MKQIIISLCILSIISCTRETKIDHDLVFDYLSKQNEIVEFGNFYAVQRSKSDTYLYRNNDYNIEYWFSVNSDSEMPFEYYKEKKNKSDEYLLKEFPEDYKKIKSLIEKTLIFSSSIFQKFDLKAINGWKNEKGKVELEFSFKDNSAILYFQDLNDTVDVKKNITKKYNENWFLVND